MCSKSLILSSAGLKNIKLNGSLEKEFSFIFGKKELKIRNIFAEFLSPRISYLHQTNPTIDCIDYKNIFAKEKLSELFEEIASDDITSKLKSISEGEAILITEDDSDKLRKFSYILENPELQEKIDELFPLEFNEEKIEELLSELTIQHNICKALVDQKSIIDFISSHFYLINPESLKKVPLSTIYSIINNENLLLENEDSLIEIIHQIFNDENADDDKSIDEVAFYEKVEFGSLSNEGILLFLKYFNPNLMTHTIWNNLSQVFDKTSNENPIKKNRYKNGFSNAKKYEYNNSEDMQLRGIFYELTKQYDGNLCEKNVINITSSPYEIRYPPQSIIDFDSDEFFYSKETTNAYLEFDLKDRKIHLTHYSLESRSDNEYNHPRSWVIEVSNSEDSDWKIVDSQTNTDFLVPNGAIHTFPVKEYPSNEYHRFIRIRQTGKSSSGLDYLTISAFECFGNLI